MPTRHAHDNAKSNTYGIVKYAIEMLTWKGGFGVGQYSRLIKGESILSRHEHEHPKKNISCIQY